MLSVEIFIFHTSYFQFAKLKGRQWRPFIVQKIKRSVHLKIHFTDMCLIVLLFVLLFVLSKHKITSVNYLLEFFQRISIRILVYLTIKQKQTFNYSPKSANTTGYNGNNQLNQSNGFIPQIQAMYTKRADQHT